MTDGGKLFPSQVPGHLICTEPLHLSSPFPIVLPFRGSLVTPLLDFLQSDYLHSYSLRYFFDFFFNMGHLKVFIEFVTILFLFYVLVFWLWGMWDLSCLTRNWTFTPCVGRQSLNHWMAREVSSLSFNEHLSVNVSESNPACPDLSLSSPTVWSSHRMQHQSFLNAGTEMNQTQDLPRQFLFLTICQKRNISEFLASLEAGDTFEGLL